MRRLLLTAVLFTAIVPPAGAAVGPFGFLASGKTRSGDRMTINALQTGRSTELTVTIERRKRPAVQRQTWTFSLPASALVVDGGDLTTRLRASLGRYGSISLDLGSNSFTNSLPVGCSGPQPVRAEGPLAGRVLFRSRTGLGLVRTRGLRGAVAGQSRRGEIVCRGDDTPPPACFAPSLGLRRISASWAQPRGVLRLRILSGVAPRPSIQVSLDESTGLPAPLRLRSRSVTLTGQPESVVFAPDLSSTVVTAAHPWLNGSLTFTPTTALNVRDVTCGPTAGAERSGPVAAAGLLTLALTGSPPVALPVPDVVTSSSLVTIDPT